MKSAHASQPAPAAMASVNFTYDAFISYSNSQDYRQLARALQRELHAFARPWNRLRAMRTYRDETHITPAANLWAVIEAALRASHCFVLLASPEAAESPWVQRELEWWLAHHGSDRLFLCVVGGSIEFERASLTLDKARTDCLPVDIADRLPASPFYVDLRPCVRYPERQSMTDETFRAGIQKLSAAIQERPLDELAGDDIRQQRLRTRVRNGAIAALTVLAAFAASFAVLAFNASQESQRQERLALVGQGGALASASALAARLGDGTNAILYASAAKGRLSQAVRPAEIMGSGVAGGTSQQQVEFSLYQAQSLPVLLASFDIPPRLLPVLDFDPKHRRLYVMGNAGLQMLEPFRHSSLSNLASLSDPEVKSIAADPTTGRVAALTSTGILLVDPDEPEKAPVSVTPRTSFNALVFAPQSGDLLAAAGASFTIFRASKSWEPARIVDRRAVPGGIKDIKRLVTARDAEIALVVSRKSSSLLIDLTKASIEVEIGGESGTLTVDGALSPDGTLAALRDLDGRVTVYRTSSGEKVWQVQANSGPGSIAFSRQGLLAVTSSAEIELLDMASGLRKYSFTTGQPDEVPMLLRFSSNDDTLVAVWQSGHANFFTFRLPATMAEIARLADTSGVQGIVPDDEKRWALGWTKEGSVTALNLAVDGTAPRQWRVKEELAAVLPAKSAGRWMLLAASGAVYVIGLDSAEPEQISPPADGVQAVTRSISDETWAFATRNGTIKISSGALVQGPAEPQTLLLNGKAGLVAALSGDSVKVWDYAKPAATLILDVSVEGASSAAFSADGRKIAVGDGGGNVHLYSLAGAQSVAVFHPHVALVSDLVFDRSGNLLASVSLDGTKALIQIQSGSTMTIAGNHNMEASYIAMSEELGLVASAGEDGGVLLNGLAHGGLIARIPVGDGRATAMLFAGSRLFLGTDGGSLRSIKLNTLQPERLELLRLSVGRTLRDDEKGAFGLSSDAHESAEQVECRMALVRTSDPYASLTGNLMYPRQFRGQADACFRAVSRHPEQPCWSRAAGLILRRQAEAFEAVGRDNDALKPREEAYALTRTSAAQGCLDAMLDIASLKEGGLADDRWVRSQLQDAANKGSGKAEVAISQLDWDHAKSEASRQQVLDKLLAAGAKEHAWALTKRAALLADEGLDLQAEEVFRDSVRADFLFEACGVNDPALDQAVGLRALALADLDEGSALRVLADERKIFEAVPLPGVCGQIK